MQHVKTAKQGHKYRLDSQEVICLENGYVVRVRQLLPGDGFNLGKELTVKASWLTPLPMTYFHGEIPA
jgi:hypothetical protein